MTNQTTPIQAAIEALKECLFYIGDTQRAGQMAHKALAALQAAPAQGSIDTAEFQRLMHVFRIACFDPYSNVETKAVDQTRAAIVAYIDAHIAQRAASGDAPGRERYSILQEALSAVMARRDEQVVELREGMNRAISTIERMMLKCDLAAPAPIADEVAGIFGPQVWSKEAEMRKSWEKIGAPDAPAGDLPLLPEYEEIKIRQDMVGGTLAIYRDSTVSAYGNACVLADRAARAAAAPAGHAEPVAWASCDKIGNGLRALTKFSTEESKIDRFVAARQAQYSGADRIKVALFAAPVAAEPAPQVIYREPTDEERSAEAVAKLCGTVPANNKGDGK